MKIVHNLFLGLPNIYKKSTKIDQAVTKEFCYKHYNNFKYYKKMNEIKLLFTEAQIFVKI